MPICTVPACLSVSGHKFPPRDNPALRRRWILAINRPAEPIADGSGDGSTCSRWSPGSRAIVCRAHFRASDYHKSTFHGTNPKKHILKKGAVPSIFSDKQHANVSEPHETQNYLHPKPGRMSERRRRAQNREAKRIQQRHEDELARVARVTAASNIDIGGEVVITTSQADSQFIPISIDDPEEVSFQSIGIQADGANTRYTSIGLSEAKMLHFYTGLETYDKFTMVLSTLGPAAGRLNYYHGRPPPIPVEDQLLLTLMKLRRHMPNEELAFMFGIDERQVSNTFVTWVNFMHCQWRELDFWPVGELVRYYCPTDFKSKFPKTRVILDGMECPIQKPGTVVAQQATFSTYKNRNTVKAVVGGCPGGLVSYVSEAFGGSASDRQIVERSSLPEMCDAGDQVMVDKGFNCDDLFIPKHVEINIPTFFKKKNRMSCKVVAKDRKIASKRVHIERLIGLGKTYKMLTEPMTPQESSLATPIIHIIFTLCNFRACIVPDDA